MSTSGFQSKRTFTAADASSSATDLLSAQTVGAATIIRRADRPPPAPLHRRIDAPTSRIAAPAARPYIDGNGVSTHESAQSGRTDSANSPSRSTKPDPVLEERLGRLLAGKDQLWRRDLRLSELCNFVIISISVAFVAASGWSWPSVVIASAVAIAAMWAVARRMAPREQRLRRLMMVIARRRRTCVGCGYQLRGVVSRRCPECGQAFDQADTRHLLGEDLMAAFSTRGRWIAAAVIVYVLFWLAAIARHVGLDFHLALSAALLLALHAMHIVWTARAEVARAARDRASPTSAHDCGAYYVGGDTTLPDYCPACERRLTFGEIFIRPNPADLADARIQRLLYRALLLRWFCLTLICGGLGVFLQFDDVMLRRLSLTLGRNSSLISLALPMLAWVVGTGLVFRTLARRSFARLKTLFAQLTPTCRRCRCDLSDTPVAARCPQCHAKVRPADIRG